jgi:hypothetical protein
VSSDAEFAGKGARSLAELPRMLAEHVDLGEHPWGASNGASQFPTAQFDFIEPDDPRVEVARDLWDLDDDALSMLTTPLTTATDGTLKLLRSADHDVLFDLADDPLEERPLDPGGHAQAERVRSLREVLATSAMQVNESGTPAPAPASDSSESDDLEARMRLLGYM